ncbi:MAG: hypothetical protein Q3M24_09600 [Candidatus Electrothrix aestuarii]|uniref:PilZ domain-containing protein n=1 Tax=Candidatus Electrothrix aestuarii TaxID=3062594 RepID=A0AAU8M0C2_9BACT|nr:hypothetical protein [Candidatus Electrothrix aestuarii]
MGENIKKRRQRRVDLTDYIAVFMERNCHYNGVLKEISLNGLRVDICPVGSQLMAAASSLQKREFCIVISEDLVSKEYRLDMTPNGKNKLYTLRAYPRWQREQNERIEVGFEISESSDDWKLFVQQRMQEPN